MDYIQAYRANDGTVFDKEENAIDHEYQCAIQNLISYAVDSENARRVSMAAKNDNNLPVCNYIKKLNQLLGEVRDTYFRKYRDLPK